MFFYRKSKNLVTKNNQDNSVRVTNKECDKLVKDERAEQVTPAVYLSYLSSIGWPSVGIMLSLSVLLQIVNILDSFCLSMWSNHVEEETLNTSHCHRDVATSEQISLSCNETSGGYYHRLNRYTPDTSLNGYTKYDGTTILIIVYFILSHAKGMCYMVLPN